jgi:hypothetical protein
LHRSLQQMCQLFDELDTKSTNLWVQNLWSECPDIHFNVFQLSEHRGDCCINVSSRLGVHCAVSARSADGEKYIIYYIIKWEKLNKT